MPPIPVPVPTPNLPFSNIANVVPAPPQDPPSVDDVVSAKNYAQRALIAEQHTGQIDAKTTANALVYMDSILAAAAGGAAAPPWFAEALKEGLRSITTKIDNLTIFTAQNHNRMLGDGRPVSFVPVPFPDGTMPSENDQTPTPLTNLVALENLSYDELKAYCQGYFPDRIYGQGQQLQTRKRSIRDAIGCTAAY